MEKDRKEMDRKEGGKLNKGKELELRGSEEAGIEEEEERSRIFIEPRRGCRKEKEKKGRKERVKEKIRDCKQRNFLFWNIAGIGNKNKDRMVEIYKRSLLSVYVKRG